MKRLRNIHPGEVLLEEFLKPMNVSQNALAREIGVPPRRINEIVLGKRHHCRHRDSTRKTFPDLRTVLDGPAGRLRPGGSTEGHEAGGLAVTRQQQ